MSDQMKATELQRAIERGTDDLNRGLKTYTEVYKADLSHLLSAAKRAQEMEQSFNQAECSRKTNADLYQRALRDIQDLEHQLKLEREDKKTALDMLHHNGKLCVELASQLKLHEEVVKALREDHSANLDRNNNKCPICIALHNLEANKKGK